MNARHSKNKTKKEENDQLNLRQRERTKWIDIFSLVSWLEIPNWTRKNQLADEQQS